MLDLSNFDLKNLNKSRFLEKAPKPQSGSDFSCIWSENHLLILRPAAVCIEGDPRQLLPILGLAPSAQDRINIHYQGADLLVIPQFSTGQSQAGMLNRVLPPNRTIADYFLAKPHPDHLGSQAMLPSATTAGIFAAAREAGFVDIQLTTMPELEEKTATLQLANGLWRCSKDSSNHTQFMPLPRDVRGSAPDWLKPQAPLLDYRHRPFPNPRFIWEDDIGLAQRTQIANRKLLIRLTAFLAAAFLLVWLGLGWGIRNLEDQLVHQTISRKQSNKFRLQYREKLDQLAALRSELQHHPSMNMGDSHAIRFRNALNACPPDVILASAKIEREHGRTRMSISGYATTTQAPLDFIQALKTSDRMNTVDLVSLRPTTGKEIKQDPRLAKASDWHTFSIRMDTP